MKRPLSLWIVLIILSIVSVNVFLSALSSTLYIIYLYFSEESVSEPAMFALSILGMLIVGLLCAIAIVIIWKKEKYAFITLKISGGVIAAILLCWFIFEIYLYVYFSLYNDLFFSMILIASIAVFCLYSWVTCNLFFSEKIKKHFYLSDIEK